MAANQPRRTKFRKSMRLSIGGNASGGTAVSFGTYGIKALTRSHVTARQIEATRRVLSRRLKRGKIWIRIFPHRPVTKLPEQVSMGSGKGSVDQYVAIVKPGTVMFEIDGCTEAEAREMINLAGVKLPCLTKFVVKR